MPGTAGNLYDPRRCGSVGCVISNVVAGAPAVLGLTLVTVGGVSLAVD